MAKMLMGCVFLASIVTTACAVESTPAPEPTTDESTQDIVPGGGPGCMIDVTVTCNETHQNFAARDTNLKAASDAAKDACRPFCPTECVFVTFGCD
jgi:hypothetical protein